MGEEQVQRVLVVDDEPYIVNAVQRELGSTPFADRRLEVETFTDPLAALARSREVSFDLVVCDYRMPGLDGLSFLKALSAIQPGCVRLVLSGRTDMDALIRMVNESRIYGFIAKPWNDHFLKGAVSQALDYGSVLREHRRLAQLVRSNPFLALPVPEREVERVVIVDDDIAVLHSLARVLILRSETDGRFSVIYDEAGATTGDAQQESLVEVEVTTSALHALELVEDGSRSCIVADCDMAEMSGIDLLQQCFEAQPDCARILIGGRLEEKALIRAIDAAHIFAFIDKPWSDLEFKAQVALALSRRRMLRDNRKLAELVGVAA